MVKFINKLTGTEMLVADDRAKEYEEAGHLLASDVSDSESPASSSESESESLSTSESESESTSEASSETATTQKNKGSKNTRSKAE